MMEIPSAFVYMDCVGLPLALTIYPFGLILLNCGR